MDFNLDFARYALPILLAIALAELLVLGRFGRRYDWRESAASLAIAVGQRGVGILTAGLYGGLFLWCWEHRLATIPLGEWWALPLLFLAEEFCYYWQHRVSHRSRWFWASHAVHHSPQHLNLSAAYRLGWTAGVSGHGFFFVPLVLIGFHPLAVFAMLGVNLLYQFWLHTELVPKLGWFDRIFNSPSNHRVHHASNAAYLDRNYGGILIVYDRLFGTWVGETEPCRYGLVEPLRSNNPLFIVFHEWLALARDLRGARTLREVAGYLFAPPGWHSDRASAARSLLPYPNTVADEAHSQKEVEMKRHALACTIVVLFAVFAATIASAQPSTPGAADRAGQMSARLAERFAAADKDKDGKLTREEAAAGMPLVSRHFDEIDTQKKGYVTMQDIQSFMATKMRLRQQQK